MLPRAWLMPPTAQAKGGSAAAIKARDQLCSELHGLSATLRAKRDKLQEQVWGTGTRGSTACSAAYRPAGCAVCACGGGRHPGSSGAGDAALAHRLRCDQMEAVQAVKHQISRAEGAAVLTRRNYEAAVSSRNNTGEHAREHMAACSCRVWCWDACCAQCCQQSACVHTARACHCRRDAHRPQ